MPRRLFSEIFETNKKLKTNAEKSEWLKKNAGKPLFYLLWLAFSDKVKWLLPEGVPPYTAWETARGDAPGRRNRPGSEPSDLLRELRRLYVFLDGEGGGNNLTQLRREKIFQEVLEGLSKSEVNVLVAVKDKKLDKEYKLSRKLLDETFPGLLDAPFTLRFIAPVR